MTNDNYTQITWPEVREGDVLMHENGDRLTVESVSKQKLRAVGQIDWQWRWREIGFTPYRRKPELPTVPGAYHDKDGVLCVRQSEESAKGDIVWWMPEGGDPIGLWQTSEDLEHRAPFTRLVPMPTREQVLRTITSYIGSENQADAVMALLSGKEADDA